MQLQSNNHSIWIESEWLPVKSFFNQKKFSSITILVDENTKKHCLPEFLKGFSEEKISQIIEVPAGEINKNLIIASLIWESLFKNRADRKSLLINLGGGMITDIGAFAASTYKRGISYIQIPTTLLSMVDASVGGKTGIDFFGEKNIIGTFSYPEMVFINPIFLKTLPDVEIKSGVSEILKHGLIADRDLFYKTASILEGNQLTDFMDLNLIYKSVEIKNKIVSEDPYEKGKRKLLNFGHTVGHAVESLSLKNNSKPLNHGQSIAIGMVVELFLSLEKGFFPEHEIKPVLNALNYLFPKDFIPSESFESLWMIMLNDKKNDSGLVNFTYLKRIGEGVVDGQIQKESLLKALEFFNSVLEIS